MFLPHRVDNAHDSTVLDDVGPTCIHEDWMSFNAARRRLDLYLRALWGRGFEIASIAPSSEDAHQEKFPYIAGDTMHLPASWSGCNGQRALNRYRAAVSHAAAHLMFGSAPFSGIDLNSRQRALIGLIEDLRVEVLAGELFPGLRKIWCSMHPAQPPALLNFNSLLVRLSRKVLDPDALDDNLWVCKGAHLFFEQMHCLRDVDLSLRLGLQLANDIGQMRIPMNTGRIEQPVVYRDDNRHLWQEEHEVPNSSAELSAGRAAPLQSSRLVEREQGSALPIGEDGSMSAELGYRIEHAPDEEAVLEYHEDRSDAVGQTFSYHEWDYRIGREKQDWCRVQERLPQQGAAELASAILQRHVQTLRHMQRIARNLRLESMRLLRKQPDGDGIDLDAAILAMADVRSGRTPDLRVHTRNQAHQQHSLSVLVLLDLSASTNDRVPELDCAIIDVARDASLLLADMLDQLGDPFAMHGFSSNGRNEVEYVRFKDFGQSHDDAARARLAGMSGQLSTRLGAAIRHAGVLLAKQASDKKLLMVITDGIPSDIDVFDPRYLEHDARHAVLQLRRWGVQSFCLSLDRFAGQSVARIFGAGHYEVLDHVGRLPEKLPRIYFRLSRRH